MSTPCAVPPRSVHVCAWLGHVAVCVPCLLASDENVHYGRLPRGGRRAVQLARGDDPARRRRAGQTRPPRRRRQSVRPPCMLGVSRVSLVCGFVRHMFFDVGYVCLYVSMCWFCVSIICPKHYPSHIDQVERGGQVYGGLSRVRAAATRQHASALDAPRLGAIFAVTVAEAEFYLFCYYFIFIDILFIFMLFYLYIC